MKKLKKILILVAALLIFAMLISCGTGENSKTDSNDVSAEDTVKNDVAVDKTDDGNSDNIPDDDASEDEKKSEQPVTDPEPEDVISENTAEETAVEEEKLFSVLDNINENAQPGTAGSTLKILPYAVDLLNWAGETSLSVDDIKEAAALWLSNTAEEEQESVAIKMQLADDAVQTLLGEYAAGALDSAGIADAVYPTDENTVTNVDAVMEALGVE